MDIVRQRMRRQTPELSAYFQTGGLVDAVLNLGLPAPIDIQVDSTDMEVGHAVAMDIARKARALSEVNDVLVPQDVDYPSLQVSIDRKRAGELGLSEKEIVDNMITALTSNAMIAPNYWVDPKSGNDYLLTVQYFEGRAKNLSDLASIPLRGTGVSKPTYLDAVTRIRHINAPTEVDHYQLRRVTDIYVSPKNEDLSRVMGKLQAIIAATSHPTNVRINVRGSVQAMQSSFKSFGLGLILSTLLVYLILVAQFESFFDPFVILLAVPTGLTGVILILWLTGTTLNIMSLMGVVMMVGIVASNSILIVEFTRQLRAQGRPLREAVALACRVRLRPVLMTSLATLIGLIPMALALGEGSEAYAPLARAIIGGLAVSVVLTVYIVPAAYYLYHRRREPSGPPAGGAPVAR
jgi:multidrug efflux pump subunit AcrB